MNPDQVKAFAQTAALQRAQLFGVRARWHGEEISVAVSSVAPDLLLESGIPNETRSIRVRFPVASGAKPKKGDPITLLAEGRTYRFTTDPILVGAPHVAEYIADAQLS